MWVVGHGWHVGLAVRIADVRVDVWPEPGRLGDVEYVEVGWGDGAFYVAERATLALGLNAAVSSDSSVLHVAAFVPPVVDFFVASPIVELPLTRAGFDDLSRYIADAYARDASGNPRRVGDGLYGTGGFYSARERYHVFNNSNQWAARALRAGGVPVAASLALYGGTVISEAARFGVVRRATGSPARP